MSTDNPGYQERRKAALLTASELVDVIHPKDLRGYGGVSGQERFTEVLRIARFIMDGDSDEG